VIPGDYCYPNDFGGGLSGELVLTGVAVSDTYTCFNKNKQRDVIHPSSFSAAASKDFIFAF
jgi:hypothetical protein